MLQVYQVLHVRIRAGPSPRPGNWILERSVDGKVYKPWQYFAVTSEECWSRYGLKPSFQPLIRHHHQPVCTHAFSKVTPVDSGEVNNKSDLIKLNNHSNFQNMYFHLILKS